MFDIVFLIFIMVCLLGSFFVGYLNGQRNANVGTPSASHNMPSTKCNQEPAAYYRSFSEQEIQMEKIIQIATMPVSGPFCSLQSYGFVYALTEDGKVYWMLQGENKWYECVESDKKEEM